MITVLKINTRIIVIQQLFSIVTFLTILQV